MLLEGLHLPLTTPFAHDGRLNLRKLEQNVAHYSLTPAAGMVVLGQTGEAGMLSEAERREVLRVALDAATATKVMMAGVARQSVAGTLDLVEDAAAMGYDAVVIGVESSLRDRERRIYFQMVADRSSLPVVLTGDLSQDLVAEMAGHAQVLGWLHDFESADEVRDVLMRTVAVKRTVTVTQVFAAVTGRMMVGQAPHLLSAASLTSGGTAVAGAPAKAGLKTRTKVVGFQVLMGGTEGMLAGMIAGAVGVAPPFAAAAPQGCYEVVAAWKDGDRGLAEEKQLRLVEAARLVEGKLGVAGLKYGCDLNGYFGGGPRLPGLPVTGGERAEIEGVMAGLKS
ncbi:dihydrodipicolinate synthase family protein [Granulicella arctica]|uniref:dihydrodipicolinate synthase family protein n=1 Tax=Granulicella arctica TaxID=940613 RepID=UPI0021DFAADF|nr:dihydrodipicolinate synthase family protein [Granulicella arctica]